MAPHCRSFISLESECEWLYPQAFVQPQVHNSRWCTPQYGPHSLLAKVDIKSAFRLIPVHPADRHLLGMQWRQQVYIDKCLPFGLHSAPKLFNIMADLLSFLYCYSARGLIIVTLSRWFPSSGATRLIELQTGLGHFHLVMFLSLYPSGIWKDWGPYNFTEFSRSYHRHIKNGNKIAKRQTVQNPGNARTLA